MVNKKDNRLVTDRDYNDGRIPRTLFDKEFNWRSTFNSGYLLPLWCDECYPGEIKTVDFGMLLRSITPLGPTMDNSFLDVYFFFVPNRLVWDHWEEFIAGYNKEAWAQGTVYNVPQVNVGKVPIRLAEEEEVTSNDYFAHSFVDFVPGLCDIVNLKKMLDDYIADTKKVTPDGLTLTGVGETYSFSALYPRSFAVIWNTYFRDENLQDELEVYTGDNDEYWDDCAGFDLTYSGSLPKAAKLKNRFTTVWPQPQKGPDVLIPMQNLSVNPPVGSHIQLNVEGSSSFYNLAASSSNNLYLATDSFGVAKLVDKTNLVASNVSNTIRQLRIAVQTEKFLYRDAKGTRYNESLISHWGQHSSQARLDMPEYLGSKSIPLQIMQVTNTAASDGAPLGSVGGQSITKDNDRYFKYACPEHGIIWCVATIRTNISYSSGIRKMYQRKDRFDFYWPEFRHIGDVPLYKKELFTADVHQLTDYNSKVFGYTPYGSELREGYNFNNGLFRADITGSLAYLTYQESFLYQSSGEAVEPTLNGDYIEQNPKIISNTLTDQNGPQFYGLFRLVCHDVMPMDPDSDPELMDHF